MILNSHNRSPIVNQFGDKYFHDVNGSAFNRIGSEALYKQHFDEELFRENTLYILVGTDSGLLPMYLMDAGIPEGTRYLFVELPGVLDRLSELIRPEEMDSKIILTTPDEWITRADEIGFRNYVFLGRTEFYRSIAAEDLHLEGYQEVGRKLQELLDEIRWQVTADMGSEVFLARQLENLAENRASAACLKGTFAGHTAVILGGGPSLDKSLPWIAKNRNNLVVIAVSRIARRLLDIELVPDIFLSIDPSQLSFDISKEMLLLWENTLLVHQHHVSPKLLGQWRGRCFYLGHRFGWQTPWNDEQMATAGPTVTNCAIDLAVQMDFSRLLFAGIDLCFSKDGFTHAQGSNERLAGPQLGMGRLWVETNGGGIAETTPDFNSAIATISRQARTAGEKKCRFYNLSEDAARIPGVDYCSPDSVAIEPLPQPAFEMLTTYLPEDTSRARRKYLEDVFSELERATTALTEIRRLSEEALEANEYFSGRRGETKGDPTYRKLLDEIEKKLNEDFPDFIRMVKQTGIRDFLTVAHDKQDTEWDEDDVDRMMRKYYQSYRNSANRLMGTLQAATERLVNRIEEESEIPDFRSLIRQWLKDEQPGRAMVWKARHGDQAIPDEFLDRFEELEEEFNAVLEEKETQHMARAKAWSQLGPVCGKLKLMFRRGEQQSLQHLLTGLEKVDSGEAKVLYHLGCGFLAELAGDVDAAFLEYNQVIDQLSEKGSEPALEEALLRVFIISLGRNDTNNALLAANCLSTISPAYFPYYADLLRITGDKMGALDVYADYLEKVTNDIATMLKLGSLYLELGISEGARLVLELVLEQDPGNAAALELISTLDGEA